MFQTLAEGFQTSGGDPHTDYIMSQNKYFGSLPNMIPAATSGLKGFGDAIQNVDNEAQNYLPSPIPHPDAVFRNPSSDALTDQAAQCAMASLDDLIRTQDPTAKSGCGWIYTPPNQGSPYPILSRGALGADRGPAPGFGTPGYKKWFFDLQEAKKQVMMDKCKALKSCTAVGGDPYSGCGFCEDNNQGIPVDSRGQPLYPGDPRGGCGSNVIVDPSQCPPPPAPTAGPQPITDRTCDVINGRLSAMCLYNQVIASGCKNSGTLAQALRAPTRMDDYLAGIRDSDAMKMYQRTANPVVNFDLFKQGQTTVDAALREVRLLASQATQPSNTALGSSARDLCLIQGAISGYDPCIELSDGSPAPFNRQCLQQLFLKMGGQPTGSLYPSNNTEALYNQQGNWGGVKRFLQGKIQQMQSGNDHFSDYNTQRTAMSEILGITPEASIKRAPYKQGVEVFWFAPAQWNNLAATGSFLKRTIERDFKQYYGPSSFPGIGGCVAWLQLTDVRAKSDASMKFRVCVDDGFYLTVNQPNDYDNKALQPGGVDKPGHFANMNWQGATWYQSNTCIPINASTPNITKAYFVDGGGWASFVLQPQACAGISSFEKPNYSLTCEERAPFLAFEMLDQGWFGEVRNPMIFGQLVQGRGMDPTRPGQQTDAPGRKAYVNMNGASSICNFFNICYQSWKTLSITMRFRSMPVKESIINLAFERIGGLYFNIVAIPINGSQFKVQIEHNLGWRPQVTQTPFVYGLGPWYIFYINNRGTGFDFYSTGVDWAINSSNGYAGNVSVDHSDMMWAPNGSWNPSPGQPRQACNVMIGSNGYTGWSAMYATGNFNYDLATVHFFDHFINNEDVIRECKSDWIYTDFPKEYNRYS